jgi:uncharacterized protein YqjF (DUF2071 family)
MHPALQTVDHRPWPLPAGHWRLAQNWLDLLFAHYPVPPAALRPLVPAELEIDAYEGQSWIGVVPFRMTGIRAWPFPSVPGTSAFLELNLRLYVRYQDRPGVWFISLDASNTLAVHTARWLFDLPYHRATMSMKTRGDTVKFHSDRPPRQLRPRLSADPATPVRVMFDAEYTPDGPEFHARPGSLEHFLTERYCLYSLSPRGRLCRSEVHHAPWPLRVAHGHVDAAGLLAATGLENHALHQPLLHFSRGVSTVIWTPKRLPERTGRN